MSVLGRIAAVLVSLASAFYLVPWLLSSPAVRYSDRLNKIAFFPRAERADRFQYFRELVVAPGERVRDATCVLCSIRVLGTTDEHATTFWGDIEVVGQADNRIEARGGRIDVRPGAKVRGTYISALGGAVTLAPDISPGQPLTVIGQEIVYYPGQRSFPVAGVAWFAGIAIVLALAGRWLVSDARWTRAQSLARPSIVTLVAGLLLMIAAPLVISAAAIMLYVFPPLAIGLYLGLPAVYVLLFAIGIAAICDQLGALAGVGNAPTRRAAGAGMLVTAMAVPIGGLLVMAIAAAISFGTGARVLRRPIQRAR